MDDQSSSNVAVATAATVILTDGIVFKPVTISLTKTITLKEMHKLAKNKFRKNHKHCILVDKAETEHYIIQSDSDLFSTLELEMATCQLFFTNKLPAGVKAFSDKKDKVLAACFVIGNEDMVEESAVKHLQVTAHLPGVLAAIGMPDLHGGKGSVPVGAAILTNSTTAYPQLVDSDIGCGMSFIETRIPKGKYTRTKLFNLANRMESIDGPFDSLDIVKEMCTKPLHWANTVVDALPVLGTDEHYAKLGTVGGSNHFVELQEFDEILDPTTIHKYGIDIDYVHVLVHSGSRSLGAEYLKQFCDQAAGTTSQLSSHKGQYSAETSSEVFQKYLRNHDIALNYAVRNRSLICKRFLNQITPDQPCTCKIDIHHNFLEQIEVNEQQLKALKQMEQEQGTFPKRIVTAMPTKRSAENSEASKNVWIHRKGATPTTKSPILVLPGSRGTRSYLVEVNTSDPEEESMMHGSLFSLAHGAGRCMTRSKAKAVIGKQYQKCTSNLLQTELGGVLICDKKDVVLEEAPKAYKDIDGIVQCLQDDIRSSTGRSGLIRILASLRPLLTYKCKDPYQT